MSITPLRTPEERFRDLPGFPFAPHYQEVPDARYGRLRVHYLDEGPRDAPVILLCHGQGCWSYAFRNFIAPLAAAGFRVIAPDYIGFGRSDKLRDTEHYSFQAHLDWLCAFFDALGLREMTAYLFDWGGFFGLRLAAERPELFSRLILSNTMLPRGQDGGGREWFLRWREQQFALPRFPQGEMVNSGVVRKLAPEIIAAYDAPYPDESYKTGPRRFPMILPIWPDDPAAIANAAAWQKLGAWTKPVLTLFSEGLGGNNMGAEPIKAHLPGARGQPHALLGPAGFYILEDQAAALVERIAALAADRPGPG
jgi:haloalkane dehalogenase